MRFLFIYPDIDLYRMKIDFKTGGGQYNPSLASLSACLKREKVDVRLLHICRPVKKEDLLAMVEKISPDIIGFSTTTFMFGYVKEWAGWLKKTGIYTICGGVHPTLSPAETIETGLFDAICVGEAEEAIVDFVRRFTTNPENLDTCENFWLSKGGRIVKNPNRPLLLNLDSLPMEDIDLFDYHNFESSKNSNAPFAIWASSRGCPFTCTYCSNETMKAPYPNRKEWGIRFRSPWISIKHLKVILERMPYIRYFNLLDSNINLDMNWYRKFIALYKDEIRLPFRVRTFPSLVSEEMVRLAKAAGCMRLSFGIEVGNEEYRKKKLRRNVTQKHIFEAVRLCKKYDLETNSFNMVGLPDETFNNMLETVRINAATKIDIPTATIFYPFPHTPLYDLCVKKGYTIAYEKEIHNMGVDGILNQLSVTNDQVLFVQRCFRGLIMCYRAAYRMPIFLRTIVEEIFNRIFSSRFFPYKALYKIHDRYFNQVYLSYLYRKSECHLRRK